MAEPLAVLPSQEIPIPEEGTGKEASYQWDNEELHQFWKSCFPAGYNFYAMDGLHPKALCSKICNDILRTNININSGSTNPNDRLLCFEVLGNLEAKFIEAGVVQAPKMKPGPNPNHMVYKRVSYEDWNGFAPALGDKPLERWARAIVEESIRRLSKGKRT